MPKKQPAIQNDEELNAACDLIGEAKLQLVELENNRDQKIQKIQDEHNEAINALKAAVQAQVAPIKTYIKKHSKRLTGEGKRSFKSKITVIKLRKTTSIKSEKGHNLEDIATELDCSAQELRKAGEALEATKLENLLTRKVEVDKQAAIKLDDERLAELNLKRAVTNKITIEPQTKQLASPAAS